VRGKLTLVLENEGGETAASQSAPFSIAGLGQQTLFVDLKVPASAGKFLLKGVAQPEGTRHKGPTISRRKVEIK
jgi:hypothetical protein